MNFPDWIRMAADPENTISYLQNFRDVWIPERLEDIIGRMVALVQSVLN